MFRNLIPELADYYHLVAPDLPGFGFSDAPDHKEFSYSFDNLAKVIGRFTETIGIDRYAIYIFDYGVPVGLRLALAHPERITAIISQNGNAYEEGLSQGWNPIQKYWKEPTAEIVQLCVNSLRLRRRSPNISTACRTPPWLRPKGTNLTPLCCVGPGTTKSSWTCFWIMPATSRSIPDSRNTFARKRPPTLAVWGNNDPFFLPPGAEAFKRDNPGAEVHFFETGHFALETHAQETANAILDFLGRKLDGAQNKGL